MENCDQGDSLVRLINNASNSFSTSSLSLVSGGSVDVSIRCLDHEHSRDGLGAHKVKTHYTFVSLFPDVES